MFKKTTISTWLAIVAGSSTIAGCASTPEQQTKLSQQPTTLFAKTTGVIPFTTELQRKWGSAVVADLDQNGWDDVITTQHGTNALIYWNEGGKYTEPTVLIKGDTHGLGVSDYDGDGKINIVVAQGGGDGGNPRRPVYFSVDKDRNIARLGTFDHFRASRGRTIKFLEANGDAALDLFATGFAPKKVTALTTNQLYMNHERRFEDPQTLTIARDAMSMKAFTTDINGDGVMDILTFGGGDMTVSMGLGDGHYEDATDTVLGQLANTKNVNNVTEIDYDNDGDFDLFLSRAPFQFEEESYYDPVNKNLAFFAFRDKFMFDEIEVSGDELVLENIQETWATYDIQLGKARKVVEADRTEKYTGGRLVVKPEDALGWPEGEGLLGMHIGYLGNGKWRIGGYVKSRLSAVVKHVVSQPAELKRVPMPARLFENQKGHFVDVTEGLGIDIKEQTVAAAAGDFNNDGFTDLAISPYGNMVLPVEHFVLMNDGGKGFRQHSAAGLNSEEIGATGVGITVLDYDKDGRLDVIFGNERGRWYLAENQLAGGQLGNYVAVNVNTSPESGAQPMGAKVGVTACGNEQVQLVGSSSDGFHHSLNSRLHFGLGDCGKVDQVTVRWANGETVELGKVKVNTSVSS